MRFRYSLLAATMLAFTAPALAGPAEDFHKLEDDYWATTLKNSPTTASMAGVQTYDRQLDEIGIAAFDQHAAEAAAFLKRLEAIPAASLSPADQANRAILKRQLEAQVEGNRFGQRMLLYSILGSYHNNLADLGEELPFRTRDDYDNYLARLAR